MIGRTHMVELAFSAMGINPHFGTPLNPLALLADPAKPRIPGGSSSGAAVSYFTGGALQEALGAASLYWLPAVIHAVQWILAHQLEKDAGRAGAVADGAPGRRSAGGLRHGLLRRRRRRARVRAAAGAGPVVSCAAGPT